MISIKNGDTFFLIAKDLLLCIFVIPLTKTGGYKMNFSHLANKLRCKITKFSGILSKNSIKLQGAL